MCGVSGLAFFSVVSSCRPRVRSQHQRSPSVEEVVEGVVVAEGRRRRPDRHGDRGPVDQLLQLDLLDLLVLLLQLIAELLQVSLSEMPEKKSFRLPCPCYVTFFSWDFSL